MVFDFGTEPVLVKHLCVDVVPVSDADKMKEIRKASFSKGCEGLDLIKFNFRKLFYLVESDGVQGTQKLCRSHRL